MESAKKKPMKGNRKNKSPVWKFFERDDSGKAARCTISGCHDLVPTPSSGTTAMRNHLVKIHPSTCLNDPDLKDSKGLIKTAYGTDVELPIVEGHILVKVREGIGVSCYK